MKPSAILSFGAILLGASTPVEASQCKTPPCGRFENSTPWTAKWADLGLKDHLCQLSSGGKPVKCKQYFLGANSSRGGFFHKPRTDVDAFCFADRTYYVKFGPRGSEKAYKKGVWIKINSAQTANHEVIMQPWQQKALAKRRTPLPERPGHRPWLEGNQTESSGDRNETGRGSATNEPEPSHPYATRSTAAATAAAASATTAAESADPAPAPAATATPDPSNSEQTGTVTPSYVFWRGDDLRRLVRMRNGGAKWSAIAEAFPERTLEALKQTYHKRRHATERLMAEEDAEAAAEAAAAGPSDGQ
ncbi:hypothetical protein FIE12Z_2702 [Fusarium flagelliforme]|uniref:Myb-like domain-containing protein n=1 Tax=Fusarium flagelliforme TaxID=2675880 RepID=A0A395MYN0_9HYPO|nr:hypothetical protein FIE12Z_2702 [Fusarium flagelliforme]